MKFETLRVRQKGAVLFADIAAPTRGFQTRDGEITLAKMVGELADR